MYSFPGYIAVCSHSLVSTKESSEQESSETKDTSAMS